MQLLEVVELLPQSVLAHPEVYQNLDLLKCLFQSQISVPPPRSFLGVSHTECIVLLLLSLFSFKPL